MSLETCYLRMYIEVLIQPDHKVTVAAVFGPFESPSEIWHVWFDPHWPFRTTNMQVQTTPTGRRAGDRSSAIELPKLLPVTDPDTMYANIRNEVISMLYGQPRLTLDTDYC
jgi:hypothetical protein